MDTPHQTEKEPGHQSENSQSDNFSTDMLGLNEAPDVTNSPAPGSVADMSLEMLGSNQPATPVPENKPKPDSSSDQFSLEALGANNPEIAKAEPSSEKKEFYETFAKQSDQHTKSLEAIGEAGELARSLVKYEHISPDFMKNYLEIKRARGLFGEMPIEKLNDELIKVEQRIIAPLIKQLQSTEFDIPEDQAEQCVAGVREAFYGMIINEQLSVDKILEILDGGIRIAKEPGSEVSDKHRHLDKLAAYLNWDRENECFRITFYEELFKGNQKDIAFLVRHEFMHAAAYSIWGEKYNKFKEDARNPTAQAIAKYKEEQPELGRVLWMVANPALAKPFVRSYIKNILTAIETSTSEEDKAHYRQTAAAEIVADLGAIFLEGSKSTDVFLDLRIRRLEAAPDEIFKAICEIEGVKDREHLFQKYSIEPAETSPHEIIRRLATESTKLQAIFGVSHDWQERMNELFKDRGANLKKPEFPLGETDDYGDAEIYDAVPPLAYPGEFDNSSNKGAQKASQKGPSLWDWITGKA